MPMPASARCPMCGALGYVTKTNTCGIITESNYCSRCYHSWGIEHSVEATAFTPISIVANSVLFVYKLREGAKLPVRAHKQDAGMDLFYCPDKDSKQLYRQEGCELDVQIPSLCSVIIPTGIKARVPENHMLEIKNKGGIAAKKSLVVGSCVVDSGFDGEIFVNLHNIGRELQTIKPGEKIAQAVLTPIVLCEVAESFDFNLNKTINSNRGDGSLGSTGV